MGLSEPDHTFQLPRRRGDPPLRAPCVLPYFTHLDVRLDEERGGFFGQDRMDLGAGVGDVCRQRFDWLKRKERVS